MKRLALPQWPMMPNDIFSLLKGAEGQLHTVGIETARLDAELLLAYALGCDRHALYNLEKQSVPDDFSALLARREQHEPLAYILGEKEFWGLLFTVSPAVLIPRPDSETLIEAVLKAIDRDGRGRGYPWHILDLGTGSGCLLITLLSELTNARGIGTDISDMALTVARENVDRHHLGTRCRMVKSDWAGHINGSEKFDIVIANPPYIPADDLAGLMPDVVQYEPKPALDGGPDGLDCYRAILADIGAILKLPAKLFFEIGIGQKTDIVALMQKNEIDFIQCHADLAGIERILETRVGIFTKNEK